MRLSTKIPTIVLSIAVGLVSPLSVFAQGPQPLPDDPSSVLQQSEKARTRDLSLFASEAYLGGGTVMDVKSTIEGLDHPSYAYTASGNFLMRYPLRETGWASFVGGRSAVGVSTANALMNAGVSWFGWRISRRGGGWRAAAITLDVAKATCNWVDVFHNARVIGDMDRRVSLQTGYTGKIVWRFH